MATIPSEEVFSSAPFKFFIGPDKKLFYAHAAAFKKLSRPFSVLIDGPMSEAQSGSAILEDTEEQTFVRFCQFAYNGDYVVSKPEIILNPSAIDTTTGGNGDGEKGSAEVTQPSLEAEAEPMYIPYGRSETARRNNKWRTVKTVACARGPAPAGRAKTSELWEAFNAVSYGGSNTNFEPRGNMKPNEEYTSVFLCHARLYVFGDKYDIASLRNLSLFKLQKTLIAFTLCPERVGDIVELIRYTYANTVDRKDPLKRMVVHYAACVIEDLAVNVDFQGLLETSGTLPQDIILMMLERLPLR